MKPNDYARKDVIKLARILDPKAWLYVAEGQEPDSLAGTELTYHSVRVASVILAAGYRDCNF